jgi:hypothetical protein
MSRNETVQIEAPDPEVVPTAKRRRFSAAYKSRILEEADACTEPGEIGALLRREGICSSSGKATRYKGYRGLDPMEHCKNLSSRGEGGRGRSPNSGGAFGRGNRICSPPALECRAGQTARTVLDW